MSRIGDLSNLSPTKLEELETVLASILALPVARQTYAQIIDGKSTRNLASLDFIALRSPIVNDGSKPSDRAVQLYEDFRVTFVPQGLKIDLQLTQNYQNALPGSREHLLRLLEITAASVNALAGMIYASFHPDTNIRPPKPRGGHRWHFRATNHFYVDFYHTGYRVFEHYPFGLLNVVGYWAETELFGGVVLFERVESGSEIINAFLHPQATSYAFQLSENQLKSFVDLGITGEAVKIPGAENVLPFAKDPDARTEPTYVTAGEAPLRIYKNEYDMPPIEYAPEESGCVVLEDERYERAMRIVKEEGLWKHARRYPAIFQDQPSLRDAYSAPNDAYSPLEDGPLNEPEDPENPDHK